MSKFKGFGLIKLIRATTIASPNSDKAVYSYEYELRDKMGNKKTDFMLNNDRVRDYTKKLLMTDNNNHAVLRNGSGTWEIIDASQYETLVAQWEAT
jgi:hypothetical protein